MLELDSSSLSKKQTGDQKLQLSKLSKLAEQKSESKIIE